MGAGGGGGRGKGKDCQDEGRLSVGGSGEVSRSPVHILEPRQFPRCHGMRSF